MPVVELPGCVLYGVRLFSECCVLEKWELSRIAPSSFPAGLLPYNTADRILAALGQAYHGGPLHVQENMEVVASRCRALEKASGICEALGCHWMVAC